MTNEKMASSKVAKFTYSLCNDQTTTVEQPFYYAVLVLYRPVAVINWVGIVISI